MPDEIDASNDRWDAFVEAMIRNAGSGGMEAEADGTCLFCSEELQEGRRWCDADCRDGWQKMKGRK